MQEQASGVGTGGKRELKVGMKASARRVFSFLQVSSYAALVRDYNPAHLDRSWAQKNLPWGDVCVHGMFTGAMFSSLLATELPGPGTIYLGQELRWKAPVLMEETVIAEVELLEEIKPGIWRVGTTARTESGKVVVEGHAVVKYA